MMQQTIVVVRGEPLRACYVLSGQTELSFELGPEAHAHVTCYIDSSCVDTGTLALQEHVIALTLGQAAVCEVRIIHLQNSTSQVSITTRQHHVASYAQSSVLVKGVLRDSARAWYRGIIRIEADTVGNCAEQYSKTLLLSADAHMQAVPALEVLAHDVQCKHGSAIGVIHKEQLQYLCAHGIAPEVAERMLIDGFCFEITEHLPENLKKKCKVV